MRLSFVLIIAALLLMSSSHARRTQADDTLFLSFETDDDIGKLDASKVELQVVKERATQGELALRATLQAEPYPTLSFSAGKAYKSADWSGFGSLKFDLYNSSKDTLRLLLRFDDAKDADGVKKGRTVAFGVWPESLARIEVTTIGLELGTEGLLMTGDCLTRTISWGKNVNPSNVVRFLIFSEHPKAPVDIYLDNFRFTRAVSGPIVDRFGQYKLREWPGKVKSDEELAEYGEHDIRLLKTHGLPLGRDKYGGCLSPEVSFDATGFFRAAKLDNRWQLMTPEGNPFYSLGVDGCSLEATSPKWDKRRQQLYEWMPPKDGIFAGAWRHSWTGGPVFYKANLIPRYGKEFESTWRAVTAYRLLSLGFNTLGCWSMSDLGKASGRDIPYTVALGGWGDAPKIAQGLPDVFDPRFAEAVEKSASRAASLRNDPWCIGYFYDNEPHWRGGWQKKCLIAQSVLKLGSNSAAKQAFVNLIKERYANDLPTLNSAWGTGFDKFDAMLSPIVATPEMEKKAATDFSAFVSLLAEKYFGTISSAIKRHDPNHLYLGCRFSSQRPKEVVAAAGKFCDVVSFNAYGREVDRASFDEYYRFAQKPFLVGEFHFGARDRGLLAAGVCPVKDQAARGDAYRRYVETLLQSPYFVGCHWFEFADQPITGRFDGVEASNIGLVDVCNNLYPELTQAMKKVNLGVYEALGLVEH